MLYSVKPIVVMYSSECKLSISPPGRLFKLLHVPKKLLLTPGPSNLHEQVRQAMSVPLIAELDRGEYVEIMDDIKAGLCYVFQTKNDWTLAICGSGHAGLEACIVNVLEEGEVMLVFTKGLWGQRAAEVGRRMGAAVKEISKPLGECFSPEEIEQGLKEHHPIALFITHGESSSGICQPLEGLGQLCHKYDCLFIVDTVASLGGVPFLMDELEVDVVFSGAQKVLNCPTGASPVSFSPRARAKVENRKTKVQSFYFDMVELSNYWGCDEGPRRYHHTGQISNTYGLREGLAVLAQEGLENSWKRHQTNAKVLWQGLQDLGLSFFVEDENLRLPTVTTVNIPDGLDWKDVMNYLRQKHAVDIAGGIGPSRGKVWRIGLLGCNCTKENVHFVLRILKEALDACRK